MRSGDEGFEVSSDGVGDSWNIGREAGTAWPKKGWGTDFSAFRFAIPELHGFYGRAIYMDADMLVLGDVAELLTIPLPRPWVCCHPSMTDVSVIECNEFRNVEQWPSISKMKQSGWRVFEYCKLLMKLGLVSDSLPWDWNCRDSSSQWTASTRLLHFTAVPWQPYKPYPTVRYQDHPKLSWCNRWFAEKAEADAASS